MRLLLSLAWPFLSPLGQMVMNGGSAAASITRETIIEEREEKEESLYGNATVADKLDVLLLHYSARKIPAVTAAVRL